MKSLAKPLTKPKLGNNLILPTIPAVAIRLLEMLSDPGIPTSEIVTLVQADPAITAKILKAANSPFYSGGRKIDSLDRAVIWIGRHAVTCLALSFSLSENAHAGGPLKKYFKDYWLQSVIQALSMETLAKRFEAGSRGSAFVSGLLMDIGRLTMLQHQSPQYLPVLDEARLGHRRLIDIEAEALPKTHADLTAELLTAWSLPEGMVAVAKHHELPPDQLLELHEHECFDQIAAANIAAATGEFLCGINPMESLRRLECLTTELYKFSGGQLDEYLEAVNQRLHETSDLFDTDTSEMPSTAELLAYAMEQLAELSLQSQTPTQAAEGQSPAPSETQDLRAKVYELEKRTCVDALTEAYNREYFNGRLAQRLRQVPEKPITIALLFGDIDKFKRINDTYGHLVGDEVLKAVSQAIRDCVRNNDVVARYGGEEFVVLIDYSNPDVLLKVADRIRNKVANLKIRSGEHEIPVTISLGGVFVSAVPADHEANYPDYLVEVADKSMYEVKRRGGNAVSIKDVSAGRNRGSPRTRRQHLRAANETGVGVHARGTLPNLPSTHEDVSHLLVSRPRGSLRETGFSVPTQGFRG